MADGDERLPKKPRHSSTEGEDDGILFDYAAAEQRQHATKDHTGIDHDAEEAVKTDLEELEEAQKDAEMVLQDWIISGTGEVIAIGGTGEAAQQKLLLFRACGVSAQKLDLSHQEIGRAGAERLASALSGGVCDGLQTLDLHRNNIDHWDGAAGDAAGVRGEQAPAYAYS